MNSILMFYRYSYFAKRQINSNLFDIVFFFFVLIPYELHAKSIIFGITYIKRTSLTIIMRCAILLP